MREIDFYDRGVWTRVPDPLPDEWIGLQGVLHADGFEFFERFGCQNQGTGTALEIYRHTDGRWFASLDTADAWQPILVADFPSIVMLTKELLPWINAGNETRKLAIIEEFTELLIGWGQSVGPLADCIEARQYHEAEMARARKLAKTDHEGRRAASGALISRE